MKFIVWNTGFGLKVLPEDAMSYQIGLKSWPVPKDGLPDKEWDAEWAKTKPEANRYAKALEEASLVEEVSHD